MSVCMCECFVCVCVFESVCESVSVYERVYV